MKAEDKKKIVILVIAILLVVGILIAIVVGTSKNKSNNEEEISNNEKIIETLDTSKRNVYGDYVDYSIDLNGNGKTTDDWKIFYKDDERVYLISSEYLLNDSKYVELEDIRND